MSTISPLEAIKHELGNAQCLQLSPETVGQDLHEKLSRLFKQKDFLINNCQIEDENSHSPSISFSGIFQELFGWHSIEVKVSIFDIQLDSRVERNCVFQINLPIDLTANNYFFRYRTELSENELSIEEVRKTILDYYVEVEFTEQKKIIFSSLESSVEELRKTAELDYTGYSRTNTIKAGLNFPSNIKIDSDISSFLSEVLGGDYDGQTPCDSSILLRDSSPHFKFGKSIRTQESVGSFMLELAELAMTFPLTDSSEIWPEVSVNGSIQIQNNNTPVSFTIEASLELCYRYLSVNLSEFPTLSRWFELLKIDISHLPHALLDIKLSYLNIGFDLVDLSVPQFDLSLTTERNINIIEGLISLKPTLSLSVYDPFSEEQQLEGELEGIWHLGSTLFETEVLYPDGTFYAFMSEGQTLDATAVAERLFPEVELPEVTLTHMELQGNSHQQSFSANIETSGDWHIKGNDIVLTQVKISMSRYSVTNRSENESEDDSVDSNSESESRSESEYSVFALFEVAEVDVFVVADYASTGDWQFEGNTGYGQEIPIGHLIEDLGNKFGEVSLPASLKGLTIQNLRISFNTKTKDFTFTCEAKLPIDDKELDIIVNIDLKHNENGSFNNSFSGHITFSNLKFDIIFDKDKTSKAFVATYSEEGSNRLNLAKLFEPVSSDTTLRSILENIEIDLKDALFAYSKTTTTTNVLFGLDIGTNINLSNLPLVGKELPPEQTISVDDLQLLIASQDFTSQEITAFNTLTPQGVTKIPERSNSDSNSTTERPQTAPLPKGLNISAKMQIAGTANTLALPVSAAPQSDSQNQLNPPTTASTTTSNASTSAVSTSPSNATWFTLQKTFGPVHFERVGVQYKDAVISFLLDAALSAAGLTLSFEGLSIGSPLSHFEPKFNLQGIGIDYTGGGAVEIAGAFLKGRIKVGEKEYDDYSGTAIIRTESLTLAAIGSYVQLDVGPSLFVYAVLDYPIGGPAFFFVTGLAAGFGYNRLLHVPPVDQIHTFPLVQEAMGEIAGTPNLAAELAKLQTYIPPSVGNYFLAIGIRFTSFKMIDSFILVSATFGHRFELDVVGLSTLVLPVPEEGQTVTPIAEVQLALRASLVPDDGFFGISAQLTNNSFLFDRKCHLTGGFAFYTWFDGDHDGDFVLTVGGYHPQFVRPSHYPTVPPLGFNWQVDEHVTFKGSGYYALTPSMLMAGASLNATWQDGSLRAWFDAAINFLISWKPYHYSADFHISIGASYTFHLFGTHHITAHVGADISIWGPDFAGQARVNLSIISFTIRFGSSGRKRVEPISWEAFYQSFLPTKVDENKKKVIDEARICTINLKEGLINRQAAKDETDTQPDTEDLGVVNPKTLCLMTDSVIPIKEAWSGEESQNHLLDRTGATIEFNIGTMQLSTGQIISTQKIVITCNGTPVEEHFDFHPLAKNAPAALWGSQLQPSLSGDQLISNLLTGYEIRAKRKDAVSPTEPINYDGLQAATTFHDEQDAFSWSSLTPFVPQDTNQPTVRCRTIRNTLHDNTVASKRAEIARDLLGDESLDLTDFSPEDFLCIPQVSN